MRKQEERFGEAAACKDPHHKESSAHASYPRWSASSDEPDANLEDATWVTNKKRLKAETSDGGTAQETDGEDERGQRKTGVSFFCKS